MPKKITVLGTGMVGRAIIYDLSKKCNVTAVDINEEALEYCKDNYNVITQQHDLSNPEILAKVIKGSDLVVSAVPGFMGFRTIETAIKNRKDIVDISFMPEDFMQLDKAAREQGVTAIADCGVAPGMPNIILAHHNQNMKIEEFEYMVGGLPKERKFPFEYKAPFSPIDVLEEYTRPARLMENGQIVRKPAMSEPELIYFQKLGHLEAFNTDGLRSLLQTMSHIPNMKEKTLRYPGHIQLIKALKEAGFFNNKPITVGGLKVKPIEVTNEILINEWKLEEGEAEFTLMRIIMKGKEGSKDIEITYDLYDEYDPHTNLSSMARTTGFTATGAVNLILNGTFEEKGVFPPEEIGSHTKCFRELMQHLKDRGVKYEMNKQER